MKKLFVGLVVAALFAPLSFAEEGKKKDSFAGVGMPTNFAMGYAKATDPCPSNGDIAMSKEGLILSCQSGASGKVWSKQGTSSALLFGGAYFAHPYGCSANPLTANCSCPSGYAATNVSGSDYDKGRWDSWGYVCWRLP